MSTASEIKIENGEQLLNAVKTQTEEVTNGLLQKFEAQVAERGTADEETKTALNVHTELLEEMKENSSGMKTEFAELQQMLANDKDHTYEKTFGHAIIDSQQFKDLASKKTRNALIRNVKNTILTVSGSPLNPDHHLVAEDRLNGIVPLAFRSLNILDVVPQGTTNSDTIKYSRELTNTNAAAETPQGEAKPESAITFGSATESVRDIPTIIKVSRQALRDAPFLASFINTRLGHMVRHKLQMQIIDGDGTGVELNGLTKSGNFTAFTPVSGDNAFDSLSKAKYATMGADYEANTVLLNPADFGAMERLKRGSADDAYILSGATALNYVANGMIPQIWGMNVVLSNDIATGKLLVLDINTIQLFMREGLSIEMFEQDSDNVQKNLITIRAELAAALATYVQPAIRYGDLLV